MCNDAATVAAMIVNVNPGTSEGLLGKPYSCTAAAAAYLGGVNICDVHVGWGASGSGRGGRLGGRCRSLGLLRVAHAGKAS